MGHGVAVPHTLTVIVGFVGSFDLNVIVAPVVPVVVGVTVTVYDVLEPPFTFPPVVGDIVTVSVAVPVFMIVGAPRVNVCEFVALVIVIVAVWVVGGVARLTTAGFRLGTGHEFGGDVTVAVGGGQGFVNGSGVIVMSILSVQPVVMLLNTSDVVTGPRFMPPDPHGTRGKVNAFAGGTTTVKVWTPVPTLMEEGVGIIVLPLIVKRMFAVPSGPIPGFSTDTVMLLPGMIGLGATEEITGFTGKKEKLPVVVAVSPFSTLVTVMVPLAPEHGLPVGRV